jgi:hypothetical protein
MSGFEVAGLVLGIIPLAISALEHYKAGRGWLKTWRDFDGQLDMLIHRLNVQRTFFHLHIIDLLRNAGVKEVINSSRISEKDCSDLIKSTCSLEI